jgi:hypothetical protein
MREDMNIKFRNPALFWKILTVGIIFIFIFINGQPAFAFNKEMENNPPNIPILIIPDGSICGLLEWYGGDPDGDSVYYDIYFGEYDPFNPWTSPKIATTGYYPGNWTYIYYQLEMLLDFKTKYEWKIIAEDQYGEKTESEWSTFITEENVPPNPAKDPFPINGEIICTENVTLCWNGSDPNKCDILTYDVYFGFYDPPTILLTANQTESCVDVYNLSIFETYYWKVITRDNSGEISLSPVWSFETGLNPPPFIEIYCPPKWPVGKELCINISSNDPNNDTTMFIIDWGDGTYEETVYYPSNEIKEFCHTYEKKGIYIIRVKAIDQYGAPSNWEGCEIQIPRTRESSYQCYEQLLELFPILKKILELIR